MYYIKSIETGEYQMLGFEEGWCEGSEITFTPYYYLVGESKQFASEFSSVTEALIAIELAEESLDQYEIVFEGEIV